MDIASGVEKNMRATNHPVDSPVDIGLRFKRLIPSLTRLVSRGPWPPRNGYHSLHRHMPFVADPNHRIKILAVTLVLVHNIIGGHEHRIEVNAFEAPLMHGGDRPAMPGHPDKTHQPLLARFYRRLQCTS